ncbi:MAG TPA: tyrosine-type recombinase/integrase [Pseudolabrys sp.]
MAIEVLLGTGQRVDDATKLKKEHIVDGMVSVPAEPTEFQQKKTGERIFIVPTERLARVLATRPHQNSDYVLNSSRGRKWANGDSLSEMITRWVVAEPGKFTTHGLRANAGIELALSGCSIEELKAVLGHRTAQIALEYLKKMNKLHLVMSATQKRNEWERRRVAEAKAKAKTPNAKAPQNGTSCQRSEQKRA